MRGQPVVPVAIALLLAVATGPGVAASRLEAHSQDRATLGVVLTGDRIAGLASSLDYDIERIHRFVADEIRYQPYPGILRGAEGTLGSGAGNSVDQALLLAALLDESAVRYRFARGPLDEGATATLTGSLVLDRDEARRVDQGSLTGAIDLPGTASVAGSASDIGPLFDHYRRGLEETMTAAQARLELAATELADDVATITSALAEAGVELSVEDTPLPSAERMEHTWIQVPFGAEWLDLDPALSGSEPGTTLTTPAETLRELPDELRHRVDFEVLLERVAGDGLETETILEYSAFAHQLAGVTLTFGHVTPAGAERLGVALSAALGEGNLEYRPFLDNGDGAVVADEPVAFGLAGSDGGGLLGSELFDDPAPAPGEPTPTADAETLADGEAVAEWLIVRLSSPGSEPVVSRRTVFDRIPAAVRHGGQPEPGAVEPIELVDVAGEGLSDYPPMLGLRSFAVATGNDSAATVLTRLGDGDPDGFGLFALNFHGLRDALGPAMALDQGARMFIDGPNIVSYSLEFDAAEPVSTARVGLDIWHRNHGVLPLAGQPLTSAEARIVAGVTSHVAERVAVDGLTGDAAGASETIGIGTVFAAAQSDGIPVQVLHDAVPGGLPYDDRAAALIEEAVEAGDVVVIPARPVVIDGQERVGWWRVEPATGATVDVMDDGSGASSTEYLVPMSNAMRSAVCIFSLTSAIAAVLGPVAIALGMDDPDMAALLATIAALGSGTLGAAAGFACSARKPATPEPFPQMPPGWKPPGALPAPPLPRGPTGTLPNITGWGVF